jgi:hypothetical protein
MGRKRKRPHVPTKAVNLSINAVCAALRQTNGRVWRAAELLKVPRVDLHTFIQLYPQCQQARSEGRIWGGEAARNKMDDLVAEGVPFAVALALKEAEKEEERPAYIEGMGALSEAPTIIYAIPSGHFLSEEQSRSEYFGAEYVAAHPDTPQTVIEPPPPSPPPRGPADAPGDRVHPWPRP